MNNKERFFWNVEHGLLNAVTDLDRVKNLVNRLIDALYKPVDDIEFMVDVERMRNLGFADIEKEPINWGSLRCNEVLKNDDGSYIVFVDEASPASCIIFCEYIEYYMKSWGWDVKVETEW